MNTLTAQQIAAAIIGSGLSNDDLNEVISAVKYARSRITKQKIQQFTPGQKVKFVGRGGVTEHGVVVSVGIKNVKVKTATTNWRVGATLLQAA